MATHAHTTPTSGALPTVFASPLRVLPLFRPAHRVVGWTPAQVTASQAAHKLRLARDAVRNHDAAVVQAREFYCDACRAIGEANQGISRGLLLPNLTPARRRMCRSIAFIEFNKRLRVLRAAEKALVAAQAAMAALLPGGEG